MIGAVAGVFQGAPAEFRKGDGQYVIRSVLPSHVLVKLELLPVANYLPDVERIKHNRVRVFIAVGQWALNKKTWYARADQILADQLGCERVTFPGHHGSFMDTPEQWAAALRSVLHKADATN